jgi:hypothetical protein
MAHYQFFANFLNFVADRTDSQDVMVATQMADLRRIGEVVCDIDGFDVAASDQQRVSRALAGVAGFLQQHILPEAVAHGNSVAEKQIRWVIDTSMVASTALMAHTETSGGNDFHFEMPPPP